jgi:hypothetical protein
MASAFISSIGARSQEKAKIESLKYNASITAWMQGLGQAGCGQSGYDTIRRRASHPGNHGRTLGNDQRIKFKSICPTNPF